MAVVNQTASETVHFSLDGHDVEARPGESILQAARRHGVEIPHLCYQDGEDGMRYQNDLRADGNCRACMVEIEGERVLAPSCCRTPSEAMVVQSTSARARKSQKLVLELLRSDMASTHYSLNSELDLWAAKLALGAPRFEARAQPCADLSHPAMSVNLDACIQCTRCVRACREMQVNDVIGLAFRGVRSEIVFDLGDPMGESSCVACGECVQACPTGALMPANNVGLIEADRKVDSVCPYCGVGCLLTFYVKDNHIVRVEGRDGPANHGRLCVKGRYGFDYVSHRERLGKPLIRKPGVPKGLNEFYDPADPSKMFRESSWEEALDFAARGLVEVRDQQGPQALAGFGSAKGSNEEAYLFQKLIRTGFGTNNVDHCTRLCHASSVAALLEGVGSGAVSNPVEDVDDAEVIMVVGSNSTANHPVAATFFKNAVKAGKTLIVIDPRRIDLTRHAEYVLQFNASTDVALFNALLHTIIDEGLVDKAFVEQRTEDYALIEQNIKDYSPEAMAEICGIPAATIRAVARRYATARASMIFWGMGVSQHINGTDNARCLIALTMLTGQIGRPGTGLHPLRGQNNVQGASDAGLIPMVLPDYQSVTDPAVRGWFEKRWNAKLDPQPGLTVVETVHAILADKLHGMYIMGENPAMSDPNLSKARQALGKLDHLVVQDLFLTETAAFADVVLPASAWPEKAGTVTNTDRRVQLGRPALDLPGDARQDLWIIQQLARRMGADWNHGEVADVYEEMRQTMPSIAGISWQRLMEQGSVTHPCMSADDPGQPVVFIDRFLTESGKARLVPARLIPAAERPDDGYPFVLITGRQLEHWHTGAMTRRASILSAIEPVAVVSMHPDDMRDAGIGNGGAVTVHSRRGAITASARADSRLRRGDVFIPFCYVEAAANLLTNDALDPYGKIPEFKYCAVKVAPGAQAA